MNSIGTVFWNEYARTCLMSFLSMCAGFQIQTTLMKKQRSLRPLVLYMFCKSMLDTVVLDGILRCTIGDTREGQLFMTTLSLCLAVGTAMMFVYTFEGPALENIIGIVLSEMILTLIWLPCALVVNYLGQRENLFTFYGQPQVWDLLLFPMAIVIPWLFCKGAGSVLRKYRSFRFRYRKLFWCGIFAYILLGQSTMFFGGQESDLVFAGTMYIFHLLFAAGLMGGIYVIYRKYQNHIQRENEFLQMQMRLLESHYQAAWQQIRKMEAGRQMVAQQMRELTMMAEGQQRNGLALTEEQQKTGSALTAKKQKTSQAPTTDRRIASYLRELRQEYDRLQAGMYCNDWLVDAVLCCQVETAKRQGMEVECSLQTYERTGVPEELVAQLFFQLLEFGIHENLKKNVRQSSDSSVLEGSASTDVPLIMLKAGKVKNRLIIEFSTPCIYPRRFPMKVVKEQICGHGEIIELRRDKGKVCVVAVLED